MNKKKVIYWAIIAIIVLAVIIPYGAVLFYTLPRSDEFSCLVYTNVETGYKFGQIFNIVADQYLKWEGNYSGVFLYILFNPMLASNAELAMYVYNIISYLIFVVVCIYVTYKAVRAADISRENAFMLAMVTFAAAVNCRYLHETLGWFTGYTYYTIQLLTGILAITLVAGMSEKKGFANIKEILLFAASLLLTFIGCGGTLQISGMLCCMTLVLLVWNIWKKKDYIKAAVLFAVTFASTLFNLASPGHGVRKDGYEEISIFKAAGYAFYCILKEVIHLCKDTYLLFILLGVLLFALVALNSSKKGLEYNPLVVLIIGFGCTYAGVLPVCYGYGDYTLASRGYEITDLSLTFWGVMFMLSLANMLKGKGVTLDKKKTTAFATVILILAAVTSVVSIEDSDIPSIKCTMALADGSVKDYSDRWREAWRQVANSRGEDVVVKMESKYVDAEEIVCRPLIVEDSQNWVNLAMTYYYMNKSVKLEIIE